MSAGPGSPPPAPGLDGPADLIADISLAQYAAVKAAVAEPFPLDDVLVVEELDRARWDEADPAWKERIVDNPDVLARYERELGVAEDRLARKIEPLERDLGAWLAFLEAYTAAPEAMLEQRGLGVNDLSRLKRQWDKRMKQEPALEKRMVVLKKRGLARMPPLRLGPKKLAPSGLPKVVRAAPAAQALSAAAVAAALAMPLDRYAALAAEIELAPSSAARVLEKYGVAPEAREALERSFRERFVVDPLVQKDFALLREHHKARSKTFLGLEKSPPPKPADPKAGDLGTLVGHATAGPALPFRVTPTPGFLEALARAPAAAPGAGSDGGTVALMSPFAAVPDEAPQSTAAPPSTSAPAIAPEAVAAAIAPAAITPAVEPAAIAPAPPAEAVAPAPPVVAEDAAFDEAATLLRPSPFADPAQAAEILAAIQKPAPKPLPPIKPPPPRKLPPGAKPAVVPKLPPVPKLTAAAPPGATAPASAKAPLKVSSVKPPQPETVVAMASPFLMKPALPFSAGASPAVESPPSERRPPPASERAPASEAAPDSTRTSLHSVNVAGPLLPFSSEPVTMGETPIPPAAGKEPPMPMERHASLCVELAMPSARSVEVLSRYQITQADKDHADAYWKARFKDEPALRDAWNQAFRVYKAWLAARPRR